MPGDGDLRENTAPWTPGKVAPGWIESQHSGKPPVLLAYTYERI